MVGEVGDRIDVLQEAAYGRGDLAGAAVEAVTSATDGGSATDGDGSRAIEAGDGAKQSDAILGTASAKTRRMNGPLRPFSISGLRMISITSIGVCLSPECSRLSAATGWSRAEGSK
jgi:hypothetical protein